MTYETNALHTVLTRLTNIKNKLKCDCQHLVGYDLFRPRVDTNIKVGLWLIIKYIDRVIPFTSRVNWLIWLVVFFAFRLKTIILCRD